MKYLALLLVVGFSGVALSNEGVSTIQAFKQTIKMPKSCVKSESDQEKLKYICDLESENNWSLISTTKFNPKRLQELKSEDYIADFSNYVSGRYSFYDFTVKLNKDEQPIKKLFSYICKGEDCLIIYSKNKNIITEFKTQFSV
jgi:hypothetical protein